MNECQEITGGLLIAGGHAPVMLDLVPKPLDQVAVLVPVPVVVPLLGAILPGRDHRRTAVSLDEVHQLLAVEALVADYYFKGDVLQECLGLVHIGCLPRRQHELDRHATAVDPRIDLSSTAPPPPPQHCPS